MKKLFFTLSMIFIFVISSQSKSLLIPNIYGEVNDCGGCIAYADSRDDGSDRSLQKWMNDLNSCRASSPECNIQE